MTQNEKLGVMDRLKGEMEVCDVDINILHGKKEGLRRAFDLLGGSSIFDISAHVGGEATTRDLMQSLADAPPLPKKIGKLKKNLVEQLQDGFKDALAGMNAYDAACHYLRSLPHKTARMLDISTFLVNKGICKNNQAAAMKLHNAMRKPDNKIKRVGPGLYKIFEGKEA